MGILCFLSGVLVGAVYAGEDFGFSFFFGFNFYLFYVEVLLCFVYVFYDFYSFFVYYFGRFLVRFVYILFEVKKDNNEV